MKEEKKIKYQVMIKNFITKKWDIMKLAYDPRTGKKGLAIYNNKREAEFCENIANSMADGIIQTKIQKIIYSIKNN